MSRNKHAALAALFWCLAAPLAAQEPLSAAPAAQCHPDRLLVRLDPQRALAFDIEVADTVDSRARGLMFRRSLPPGTGMLFIYKRPQPVSFWMRNTLIPLDMVFIDAWGVIRHIHDNARPLDETPVPGAVAGDPHPERLMVLEIAGGEAQRLGLEPGQAIAHPALGAEDQAWPCA
jgi:uncharacterized protein